MDVQSFDSGKTKVVYGIPVEYQSPLWVLSQSPEEVVYSDNYLGQPIARVYQRDSEWYLATCYIQHWMPIPALSKYEAFLLLLNIHKQRQ
jgi:hypothetical protein